MSRPTVPDEQPPFNTEQRLRDYLARMFRACRLTLDNLFRWTVDHVALTAPDYKEDPHEQYFHMVNDSAFGHMFYQEFLVGKPVADGAIITNWDQDIVTAYNMTTDLAAGTVTFSDIYTGIYNVSVGCDLEGNSNTTYFIQLFVDGVASELALPIVLKGNLTNARASFSGVAIINPGNVIDLRVIGAGASVMQINLSFHRIAVIGEYDSGVVADWGTPTLPPNYGQAGP